MRKGLIAAALIAMVGASIGPLSASGAATAKHTATATLQAAPRSASSHSAERARYYTPKLDPNYNVTQPTLKFFSATAIAGGTGHHFPIKMMGTYPSDSAHPTSTINVKIIPLALHFTDGVTLDPTATMPVCAGGGTAVNRTTNSGLFKNINTNLGGPRQFLEAERRSEFWFLPGGPNSSNPNYSLRFNGIVEPKTTASVNGPSVAEPCGRGGNITISSYDAFVKNTLIPSYGAAVKTTDFIMVITQNIVLCTSSCGILGYHSAYQRGGATQVWGTSEYAGDQRYNGIRGTSVLSHEMAEAMDDPFVDNGTDPWGHIGQVSGCQSNFENGDPLTGTLFTITTTTGTKSQVQDLAEFSWFYRNNPSLAFNHWFSFFGTFKVAAKPCP